MAQSHRRQITADITRNRRPFQSGRQVARAAAAEVKNRKTAAAELFAHDQADITKNFIVIHVVGVEHEVVNRPGVKKACDRGFVHGVAGQMFSAHRRSEGYPQGANALQLKSGLAALGKSATWSLASAPASASSPRGRPGTAVSPDRWPALLPAGRKR